MANDKREKLISAAGSFCDAFANQKPFEDIFKHFSRSEKVLALEHGLPELAPFLGRKFEGSGGVQEYFSLISSKLRYENMWFDNYIVDSGNNQVSVRGHAKFCDAATNQAWDEVFAYQLAFDSEYKVVVYEIWSDTGAAYLASKGQLQN